MKLHTSLCGALLMAAMLSGHAQEKNNPGTTTPPPATVNATITPENKPTEEKKWYDRILLRGYMQFRQNNLVNTNENLTCAQCDASWGGNGGVSVRRARIVVQGQMTTNVFIKLEADFATALSSTAAGANQNFTQVRDAYADIGFDPNNELKIRLGQSKVPYGFENLQSSGTRLSLDRSDAINSALNGERDMGAFLYYTPMRIKKLYADLVNLNYKGSGDFGILAFGIYNGQTTNRPEMNRSQHVVARATYPFTIGKQMIEAGIQAYTGRYVMYDYQLSSAVTRTADKNYIDQRAAASFVLYPKPFGIQAEYNIGRGPQFDKPTQAVITKDLEGGYILANYRIPLKNMMLFPYSRYQYYKGGRKFELDARYYAVHQFDFGTEWIMNKYFKFTAEYCVSSRNYIDFVTQNNAQKGSSLRVQAQVNF